MFVSLAPEAEVDDTAAVAATAATPVAAVGGYDQYRALYDYEVNPNSLLHHVQEV